MKLDFQIANNRSGASSSRNTNISETQNIQSILPASNITIVHSAQSNNATVRIVPSATYNVASDFPVLNSQQSQYGAPNWKVYLI